MKIPLYSPELWFTDLSIRTKPPGGSLKHRFLGPTARESGSVGLGCGQRVCLSRKSVGSGDAAGPGATPKNHGTGIGHSYHIWEQLSSLSLYKAFQQRLFHTLMNIKCCCCSVTVPTVCDPWTAAHRTSLSLTISWGLPKFMFIVSVRPSSHPSIHPSIYSLTSFLLAYLLKNYILENSYSSS